MVSYVFAPPAVPTLPIVGSDDHFPVHRIYCVGRNFADHAIEMGHDPNQASRPSSSRRNADNLVVPHGRVRRLSAPHVAATCIMRSSWWWR